MDDTTKNLLKWAAIGVGVYLLLKETGLWAQIFGANTTFADSASLLAYCKANPNGTATFAGTTLPCSQWLAAASTPAATTTTSSPAPQPSIPAATVATTTPTPAPIDTALANQLTNALQSGYGRNLGTVSEWNWLLTNQVKPGASIITQGTQYAVDQQISATDYLNLRQSLGMSGVSTGMGDWMDLSTVYGRRPM
jgi:hypothetical protein